MRLIRYYGDEQGNHQRGVIVERIAKPGKQLYTCVSGCSCKFGEHHGLTNVITVRKALSGVTGTAQFYMGGTMASGIGDFIVYADSQDMREVPTLTMEDACNELGCVPNFVKMDIEGAELAFLQGAKEFLRSHPVHFAIESYHRVDGEYTYKGLEPIFTEIGYKVLSSDIFQQMFTWAAPPL